MSLDPRKLAAQVGDTMYAADRASPEFMQIELVSCAPGRAVTPRSRAM